MCLHVHQKYGFGQERKINLWLRVGTGDFQEIIGRESADLAIPGMPATSGRMFKLMNRIPGGVLFVADSGLETPWLKISLG